MPKKLIFFALLLGTFLSANANAAETPWSGADQIQARLVSAPDEFGGKSEFEAGLEINLGEGWHTYWKMPGDSGLPPRFDWTASQNISEPQVFYPAPERKDEAGLQVFGYTDRVFFPLKITVTDPAQPAIIDVKASIMACKEICIPQDVHVALKVESGAVEKISKAHQSLIDLEKRKVPESQDTTILKTTTVVIGKDALAIGAYSKAGFDRADVVVFSDDLYFTSAPKIEVDAKDKSAAIISLPKPQDVEDLNKALSGKTLTLLLTDGRNAIEKQIKF